MHTEEFARRVQASFDAAFGSGTSAVKVLGPSPDDVKAIAFEVLVRPPFGASFAIPNAQLKDIPETDESAVSIASLSCRLGRDMLEPVQQFMNALMLADPSVFLPDEGVVDVLEILDEANRETASEGAFSATKKPVTVQVMFWDGTASGATPIIDWILSNGGTARYHDASYEPVGECIAIDTLEGMIYATSGDVVIRGVQGEFYPCKPDIFEATHYFGEVSEEQSDIDELKMLLEQALEERDAARLEVDRLHGEIAEMEVSE